LEEITKVRKVERDEGDAYKERFQNPICVNTPCEYNPDDDISLESSSDDDDE
jgi:hypothetical protein